MSKSAKLIWLKDAPGGSLRAKIEAPALTLEEFRDLIDCARRAGFIPLKSDWEAPETGSQEATSKFINDAHKMGVTVVEEGEP